MTERKKEKGRERERGREKREEDKKQRQREEEKEKRDVPVDAAAAIFSFIHFLNSAHSLKNSCSCSCDIWRGGYNTFFPLSLMPGTKQLEQGTLTEGEGLVQLTSLY